MARLTGPARPTVAFRGDKILKTKYEEAGNQNREPTTGPLGAVPVDASLESETANSTVGNGVEPLAGYDVVDEIGEAIGNVHNVWTDEMNEPVYVGVKTSWLFGKNHVVPVHTATVNEERRIVQLPYQKAVIKSAPSFNPDAELSEADVEVIQRHYSVSTDSASPKAQTTEKNNSELDEARVLALHEEKLKVVKHEIDAGSARIRKVVRTATVGKPVELRREEFAVEHLSAKEAKSGSGKPIGEGGNFTPRRREDASAEIETTANDGGKRGRRPKIEP